jgi:hemolysin activation/secretion protein
MFLLSRRLPRPALCILLGMCAAPATVLAQPALPDAGGLQRQIEQEAARQQAPALTPPRAVRRPTPARPGSVTVVVRQVVFSGQRLVDGDRLQALAAPWLNQPLDAGALKQLLERVEDAYQQDGWLASARLRRQDVTDGVLHIDIVEARFGGARTDGAGPTRVPLAQVLAHVGAVQPLDAPFNSRAVDRALLLMDDLPGVSVTGNLVPGEREGTTALVLSMADEPAFGGSLQADNAGGRATGSERVTASLGWASPTGRADAAQLQLMATRGSRYARAGWTLPLGHHGLRVNGHASWMDYRVVSPELSALDAQGRSASAGLGLQYPLVRGRQVNLNAALQGERRRYLNEASGSVSSRYRVDALTATLGGNLFDDIGGGGANAFSLQWVAGRVNLTGSPNAAADAQTAATAGAYHRLTLQASRQQALGDDLALFIAASAQAASRNLDSSEKLYLGGASGVRAYPASEGGGSTGQTLSVELRRRLGERWLLTGFVDAGRVRVHKRPTSPGGQPLSDGPASYGLQGGGASLTWQGAAGLSLSAAVAHRFGSHPAPAAQGRDQDGSVPRTRLWLAAVIGF